MKWWKTRENETRTQSFSPTSSFWAYFRSNFLFDLHQKFWDFWHSNGQISNWNLKSVSQLHLRSFGNFSLARVLKQDFQPFYTLTKRVLRLCNRSQMHFMGPFKKINDKSKVYTILFSEPHFQDVICRDISIFRKAKVEDKSPAKSWNRRRSGDFASIIRDALSEAKWKVWVPNFI